MRKFISLMAVVCCLSLLATTAYGKVLKVVVLYMNSPQGYTITPGDTTDNNGNCDEAYAPHQGKPQTGGTRFQLSECDFGVPVGNLSWSTAFSVEATSGSCTAVLETKCKRVVGNVKSCTVEKAPGDTCESKGISFYAAKPQIDKKGANIEIYSKQN